MAVTGKGVQQVLPAPQGGWNVKKRGATKATKHFTTKAEAIAFAEDLSKRQGVGIIYKKKDGKFQEPKNAK